MFHSCCIDKEGEMLCAEEVSNRVMPLGKILLRRTIILWDKYLCCLMEHSKEIGIR